jgi:type II secretory ATPase GspE/PulE/Tfp pilus assembly ATPase PilB-like protein
MRASHQHIHLQRERNSQQEEPLFFISTSSTDRATVDILNEVFSYAIDHRISDVHLESTEFGMDIRMRHAGRMTLYKQVPSLVERDIDSKIRSRCRFSSADRMQPFDGKMRFQSMRTGATADVRVSLLPSVNGVSIVCRILDANRNLMRLDDIVMPDALRQDIRKMIQRPQGMFLVSGPTGSGKTTTLYGILQEFDASACKIITIEDPVEYRIHGFTQAEVTPKMGFAGALRSILRQDPDIVLVGEIRDSETARIAVQAALTGHLVLSTIHANDSVLTVTRLLDLDVEPNALSAALTAVSAQRLLRRVCQCCATPRPLNEYEIDEFARAGIAAPMQTWDINPDGCDHCVNGWSGRMPIYEFFTLAPKARLCVERADVKALREFVAQQPAFMPLLAAGLRLAADGYTTVEEVESVVGSIVVD